MKSARFNRLLISTALGLVLVLGSHASMAQQSDQRIDSAVPMPDTDLLPPLTAKDVAGTPEREHRSQDRTKTAEPESS